MIGLHKNGYRMSWAPPPMRPPQLRQAAAPASVPFVESVTLAIVTDTIVGITSAYLAWGFSSKGRPTLGTFLYMVAAASGVKLLHDFSRVEKG